jgi:hypothetical protein
MAVGMDGMRCAALLICALLFGCGDDAAGGTDETGGPTTADTSAGVGPSSGETSASADSTTGASAGSETAGESGTDTGEPPPPSCDGIGPAVDDRGITPGDSELPWPTLEHLSITWAVEGDTNYDASVSVRYREVGGPWREGPVLVRGVGGSNVGFSWPQRFAGSLFGLAPDTAYEVELFLSDHDGGCEVRTLQASTRPVPEAMDGAPVIPVDPGSLAAAAAAAAPGDVLELAAGTYPGFTVPNDGTPEAPIVIRAAGDVTFTDEVRLDGRAHVIVEGIRVQGQIKFNGGVGIAIKGCTVEATADGIAMLTRGENVYIADNVVTGPTSWTEPAVGADGDNLGEGIVVTGPGHVIEHNRVTGFRDGISFLEDDGAVEQISIDVLYNDVYEAADDGIEADFCVHNCRIIGNRLTNTFIAMSSQPGLGGPTWFMRNSAYNVILSAFKLQRSSIGDIVVHNTVVKNGDALGIYTDDVFALQIFRNNLFIGGPGGSYNGYSSGSGNVIQLAAADTSVNIDYDAYGSTTGAFTGRIGAVTFESLEELRSMTTAQNAIEVGLDVFAAAVPYPASPFPALEVEDLRPAQGSAVVDAGLHIGGINDDFDGSAPDVGAYEAGRELPTYGPR